MSFGESLERLDLLQSTLKKAGEDEEAQALLGDVGYPLERFEEGQALHDAARSLITAQTLAEIAYEEASKALHTLEAKIDTHYGIDRAIAQDVFKDDAIMLDHLGLKGERDETVQGRFEHGRKLYETPLKETQTADLAKGGLPATRRAERLAKLRQAQSMRTDVETKLAAQKHATDTRDEGIKQALAWLTAFRTLARKVFKEHPRLLDLFDL